MGSLLDELRDYETPEERLSELAAQDEGFPFLELHLQELRVLNLLNEEFYDRKMNPIRILQKHGQHLRHQGD